MGDRGNIFFVDREISEHSWGGLYMYSHWAGGEIARIAQRGLARGKSRWGDSQYLARIVFSELVRDDIDGTTGAGLSTQIGDNDHAIVRVNDLDRTVALCEPGAEADRAAVPLRVWSYAEFVEAQDFGPESRPPTEDEVRAAAEAVLGARELEILTNEETGLVELYVVVTAKKFPLPPNDVDIVKLRATGIEVEEGDEFLFPIYYLPEHEALAAAQDATMARVLGYPTNVFEALGRAFARLAENR